MARVDSLMVLGPASTHPQVAIGHKDSGREAGSVIAPPPWSGFPLWTLPHPTHAAAHPIAPLTFTADRAA